MRVSVIICTHNPRTEYLRRTLDGLKAQTVPNDQWEFLLIDNASNAMLAESWNLDWHPAARHVREENLGLANARLRAIREVKTDLCIFVDDDNVLDKDYVEQCLRIANECPHLGVWGGQQRGEFEVEVPVWLKPYLPDTLAVRQFEYTRWSNFTHNCDSVPFGAGMCVRTSVGRAWAEKVSTDERRSRLGRIGQSLGAGEDVDLALTACELGMGTGLFSELQLTHLIPKERLNINYLARLVEGGTVSGAMLNSIWRNEKELPKISLLRRLQRQIRIWRKPKPARVLERAKVRGYDIARELLDRSEI